MTRIPGVMRRNYAVGDSGQSLSVFTVTGARPGPVLATIGAIHGDEYEGPVTLSALLDEIVPERLSGTWIVLPLANPAAAAACTRSSPLDGKNLARVFPGDAGGSYTEQLAALITEHVIAPADAVLDLHSGGNALDSAFFAGYTDEPGGIGDRARAIAEAFGAPIVWRHEAPNPPGRTMSVAGDLGIPGVYVESAGGSFPPEQNLFLYRRGVLRVLAHLGMYPPEPEGLPPALHVVGAGDLDVSGPAPATGICSCHVAIGEQVAPETLCFTIRDLNGSLRAEVRAGAAGTIMFCRRNRWVEVGETLFALAREMP